MLVLCLLLRKFLGFFLKSSKLYWYCNNWTADLGSVLKYSPHKSVGQNQMFPKQIFKFFFNPKYFVPFIKYGLKFRTDHFAACRQEQNVNQMQRHKWITLFFSLNSNVAVWQIRLFICQHVSYVTFFLKKKAQQQKTTPTKKTPNWTFLLHIFFCI